MKTAIRIFLVLAFLTACSPAQSTFSLKDGDRVVFFGDSITQQRLYTTFVESYVVTRFPKMNVTFVHSGWGGDRVTGGGGGGIQQRLERDVLAYKPSVVTIMLGMNDGRYRAMDEQIFDIYSSGYKNIVKRLKEGAPGVRILAIEPSPYDDVTRKPGFSGGYNAVLLQYADFVKDLAAKENLGVADLNRPVVAMLEKANASDPKLAQKILPDRVHPGASGHLIMAESLLKAWKAPEIVSLLEIDVAARKVSKTKNTSISGERFGGSIAWTQTDQSLPLAVDMSDPVMALAVNSSDFLEALDQQIVKVSGLSGGNHTLLIDGEEVVTRPAAEWAKGVNLAALKTPMWAQAARVHALTLRHNDIHFARWRTLQVPLEFEQPGSLDSALQALDTLEAELVSKQRAMAQPKPHQFELVVGDSAFKPIFNGTDLTGWHISKINHHGNTQAWKVEDGVITGTQDKPRNGGILLTDKKYRNFEVSLEINPSFGCDSGLFLRATEKGEAYQVLLDYLDGGAIGGVYGEKLPRLDAKPVDWQPWFKRGEWNQLRARIEGDVPHIQVWLNGVQVTDWRDTENHLPGGATDGMIAVQVHGGNRWIPGGQHRFRNIQVRELK